MSGEHSFCFFHVCTDGNYLDWLFKDDEDFKAGVNRIAICSLSSGVEVYAFTLMDNHVHLVLMGTMPMCKRFICEYKLLTGKWISKKYNLPQYLKHLPTQIIPIVDEEQLLDTIAYLDRNSVVAGFRCLPSEYPWGSARYLFKHDAAVLSLKQLSEFPKNAIRKILNTDKQLPEQWSIDQNGMIYPPCFIDIAKVEHIFKSPMRYIFYLSKKLEGKVEMQQGTKTFFLDKELRIVAKKLAQELCGKNELADLDFNSKIALARKLRYSYASTPKQIARILSVNDEILSQFI